jgi:hypothetical protein
MMTKDKCFVIMPFGIKPIPDHPGQFFNFDKIYRTIIRRAVGEADMEAIRADEQSGSHIIHSAMFRELRDRAVVLADLSLGNPNVYYELGIRHVLSSGGTVLMCREGTELPFDIRLSRVVFYRYNGTDIDWEVVEEIVPRLKDALLTARERRPDSPVHALLENVYPEEQHYGSNSAKTLNLSLESKAEDTSNRKFEELVAKQWIEKKEEPVGLIKQNKNNIFGMRALGVMCLLSEIDGEQVFEIAKHLYYQLQYDLSYRIIKNLEDNPKGYEFTPDNYIKYGSVVSERDHTVKAADEALKLMKRGLEIAEKQVETNIKYEPYQIFNLFNSIGGLQRWKWQITKSEQELSKAIEYLYKAAEAIKEIGSEEKKPVGRIAQLYLRLMVLKRIQDNSRDRFDREDYLSTILSLVDSEAINEREASYLRWYKIIAHADAGNENRVREGIFNAIQRDRLVNHTEIGGAQYVMLRRFIDNNLLYLRNHTLVGLISQDLQYASRTGKIE